MTSLDAHDTRRRATVIAVILWMTGAMLSFCVTAVAVRNLARTLTVFDILTLRAAIGLTLFLAVAALYRPILRDLSLRRAGLHVFRNVAHFAATYLWTLGVTILPLATVFALEFTTPAYTTILAALFLREKLSAGRVGVVVCGILGVLVIVRPGFETFQPAAFVVLLSALGYALAHIAMKRLTRTESAAAVIFWMSIVQLPLALAGATPGDFFNLDAAQWAWGLSLGVTGLSAHFCFAKAMASGDASVVVPLDFMRIPLIGVIGWAFFSEPLDALVLAGSALIFLGIFWNLHSERARQSAEAKAARGSLRASL